MGGRHYLYAQWQNRHVSPNPMKKLNLIYILDDLRMSSFSANSHLWVIYFFKIFMDHSIYVVYMLKTYHDAFGWWLLVRLSSSCSSEVSVQSLCPELTAKPQSALVCRSESGEKLHGKSEPHVRATSYSCGRPAIHFSSNQAQKHWSPSGNHQLQIFLLQSINSNKYLKTYK